MGNNSYGALKAKLTRHANEYIREFQKEEILRKSEEIALNRRIWERIIEKLKIAYPNFDKWYDSPAVPEYIMWRGEDFKNALSILKKRLKFVKSENKNVK